jgi:hypothetical protein
MKHSASGHCPTSEILNNQKTQRFKNCVCFLLQVRGRETSTLFSALEKGNLKRWTAPVKLKSKSKCDFNFNLLLYCEFVFSAYNLSFCM